MAISVAVLTEGGVEHNSTSITTASVSPTEEVVIFAICNFHNTTYQPTVSSISGCGLTWTKIDSVGVDTSGGDRSTIELWKGLGTPSSGTITLTYTASVRRSSWIVQEVAGADTTTPVVQSAVSVANSSNNPITATLSAFADATNNATFVQGSIQSNLNVDQTTFEGTYTEIAEAWFSYAHQATAYQVGQDTSISVSFTGSGKTGCIAVEIAAGSSGPATQTINCNLITASSTLFNPTIINTQEINLNVITASSTILSPTVRRVEQIVTNVVTASSTVLNPSIIPGTVSIVPNVILATSTLFSPSVTVGAVTVSCNVLTTTSTLFNPTVVPPPQTVSLEVIAAASTVNAPSVAQDIALNVINTVATLLAPSLVQNIELSVINAPETVLTPATDTSANVELLTVTATSTIFAPGVNQDVQLNVINAPATVLNPQVPDNLQITEAPVINVPSTVFSPTVSPFNIIAAEVIAVPSTVYAPSTKYKIALPVINTSTTVHSPSLEYIIMMPVLNTAPTLHIPSIGEPPDTGGSGAIVKTHDPSPFPIGIR